MGYPQRWMLGGMQHPAQKLEGTVTLARIPAMIGTLPTRIGDLANDIWRRLMSFSHWLVDEKRRGTEYSSAANG